LPITVAEAHLDHRIPVAAGGPSSIDNLQWVHPMANSAKGSRSDGEFRAWLLAAATSLRAKLELEALL
jgi:5-methylcytosine-specific restriction endonuclease McrA